MTAINQLYAKPNKINIYSTMLKTVIIEDEKNSQELLKDIITEYCPSLELCGIAASVSEAILLLEEIQPDLVFLDVDLIGGNGFDLLDQTSYKDFKVIMTTAHEQYAIKAFKYDVSEYLLKPYSPSDVIKVIDKLKSKIQEEQLFQNIISGNRVQSKNVSTQKLTISTSTGIAIYAIDTIVRLEAESSYTSLYFTDRKSVLASKTLKDFEQLLPKDKFFRTHDSHLINVDRVKEYVKESNSIILDNGDSVPVSKRKKQEFLEFITNNR
jgi:two-component system, LytTR family, response regulator